MTQTTARNAFIVGTAFFTIVFLYLTYDSIKQMPARTHEDTLTPEVVAGKRVWQKYNCNDCHTILGIGGYYAPDVTKTAKYRDHEWLERFLKDPQGVWPAQRKMPNFNLSHEEIGSLSAFLTWVSDIDTNGWPPKPMMAAAATEAPVAGEAKGAEGAKLFVLHGCQGCHTINGVGGKVGPDLSHIARHMPDKEMQIMHMKDPRSMHPDSTMPSFAKLPEHDLEELADYLVTLK